MESLPHDWVPEPDWCSLNMKGSEVRSSPVDSILVEKDNLVLPNQNPESKIPRRKADEPSAAVAGGGSLKLGTGVQVELKGSPLAQLGGVSFSSSCTSVSSPGDPLELKPEDEDQGRLGPGGLIGGVEALHTRRSSHPVMPSGGNTPMLSTPILEAKKTEKYDSLVVERDKEEWPKRASPCPPAARVHVEPVRNKDAGSREGRSKNISQSAKIVTIDASPPSIIQSDSLTLTRLSEERDIISKEVGIDSPKREGSVYRVFSRNDSPKENHPLEGVGSPPSKGIHGSGVKESRSGPQVCHLLLSLGGVTVRTCIDSGATFSLLADPIYDQLKKRGKVDKLLSTKTTLKGASGKLLPLAGECQIQFDIPRERNEVTSFTAKVLVGQLEGIDMLLGVDWLTAVNARL
ncbi:MAG: retroviral-like aspartic protease, partial [Gammaproteobacteria bacterium]|nr:retroviral-like aspartic protease [Gammaproteobacteria bacterium]